MDDFIKIAFSLFTLLTIIWGIILMILGIFLGFTLFADCYVEYKVEQIKKKSAKNAQQAD